MQAKKFRLENGTRHAAVCELGEIEKVMVVKYHNMIYRVLHDCQLPVDDWYGTAAVGLCRAVMGNYEYHEDQFDTFCYVCIKNAVLSELKRKKEKEPPLIIVDFSECETHDGKVSAGDGKAAEETMISEAEVTNFRQSLLRRGYAKEARYMDLKMAGYSIEEIASRMGITVRQVYTVRKKLAKHISRYYADGGGVK